MKIILFGSKNNDFTANLVQKIYEVSIKNGAELVIADEMGDFCADFAISLGGDGTFLTTAAKIGAKNIPILGINAGRLGFLADVSEKEIDRILPEIIAKKYLIVERSLLQVSLSEGNLPTIPFALNEIAVLKTDTSSMINITTFVNNEQINVYKSDGLIISTPTGSTAYSLSVGGPILSPDTKNFVILPVASHSLTVRPLVICDDCEIKLKVSSRTGSCQIAVDGRSFQISDKTEIFIKKADFNIKSIKPQNHSFYNTLKNKLMWGKDARKS